MRGPALAGREQIAETSGLAQADAGRQRVGQRKPVARGTGRVPRRGPRRAPVVAAALVLAAVRAGQERDEHAERREMDHGEHRERRQF
jgi:hypothetical protein